MPRYQARDSLRRVLEQHHAIRRRNEEFAMDVCQRPHHTLYDQVTWILRDSRNPYLLAAYRKDFAPYTTRQKGSIWRRVPKGARHNCACTLSRRSIWGALLRLTYC